MGSARHPLSVVLTSERFHTAYMLTSKPAATKVPRYFFGEGEGGRCPPRALLKIKKLAWDLGSIPLTSNSAASRTGTDSQTVASQIWPFREWLTDLVVGWLLDSLHVGERLTEWLSDWMAGWMIGKLDDWLTGQLPNKNIVLIIRFIFLSCFLSFDIWLFGVILHFARLLWQPFHNL